MRLPLAVPLAAVLALAPLAVSAQEDPYAPGPPAADEQIHGRVVAFDGAYDLTVRDDRGFVDTVELHQGTIINPTGLTLAPGMVVSILGENAGSYLAANEVDTPYTFDADVPVYDGHPWDFYGPSVSLGFFFGGAGGGDAWWHGSGYGGVAYGGGVRVTNVHVTNVGYGRGYGEYADHGGYTSSASYGGYGRGGYARGGYGNGGGSYVGNGGGNAYHGSYGGYASSGRSGYGGGGYATSGRSGYGGGGYASSGRSGYGGGGSGRGSGGYGSRGGGAESHDSGNSGRH